MSSETPKSQQTTASSDPSGDAAAKSPKHVPLALPPIPTEEERHILDVTEGNKVKLDELGPMIINSDGTVSRISNWPHMSQLEKDRTIRLLVRKRNVERISKLNDEEQSRTEGNGDLEGNETTA